MKKIKKKSFSKRNLIKEFIISVTVGNIPNISLRALDERIARERKINSELIDIFNKICINPKLYREYSLPLIKKFILQLNAVTKTINCLDLKWMKTKRGRRYLKEIFLKKINNFVN